MPIAEFVDPVTKRTLRKDAEGNLYDKYEGKKLIYKNYGGSYDFVLEEPGLANEKRHYDETYLKTELPAISAAFTKRLWQNETEPWYGTLLDSLGEISGKRILLLGNGTSYRELYFYYLGANVVYTDLSIEAIKDMHRIFQQSEHTGPQENSIEFHAVNALQLPFENSSFDIVYGSAFVHHLSDMDRFLNEVHRCLKKEGKCRFFDQADSPLWDKMKETVLKPLQLYSYWKFPRSPEDMQAAHRKTFNLDVLYSFKLKYAFRSLYFVKEWFFLSIIWRHYGKHVSWNTAKMEKARSFLLLVKRLDRYLLKSRFMRKNGLMLIWGFDI